jgi:WD40-like Beta Propeller Repeat
MRVDIASARTERLSRDDERTRFGAYARDGRSIYFSSDRSGAWQVWRMDADGANAEQLSTDGGYDPRDWLGDGAIYYSKETDRGLFRLDLATRKEQRVSWMVGYWNMDAFALREDGLWFLEMDGEDDAAWLMNAPLLVAPEADDGPNQAVRMHRLEGGNVVAQMSMAADLSRMVTVAITRDETDVMTMPLPGG